MSNERIETQLTEIGDTLRQRPSVRGSVMQRVTEAALNPTTVSRDTKSIRRMITRFAAIAAGMLIVAVLWSAFGTGGLGAQQAFAAAIANVEKAKTFSARKIHRWVDDKGQSRETVAVVMMREPNLERREQLAGMPAEITIIDYAARKQLYLRQVEKTAALQDISTRFSVDSNTGQTRLTKLDMSEREKVLTITAQAVTDLGRQKLDGQDVRVLRSADAGEPIKTVWLKPDSNVPVQIELAWPSRNATYTFASIRVDEPIADAMFSLAAPAGYVLSQEGEDKNPRHREIRELDGQMMTKAKHVAVLCNQYLDKKGDFPEALSDLAGVTMNEPALRALLAAPGDPNGPSVFVYRKVRADEPNAEKVMVYETEAFRRPGHVVAGFGDGHSEWMTEESFNKLMK